MKSFVLVLLLIFFWVNNLHAQDSKAREIVNRALQKHTSGKILRQYAVKMEYDKPGKTPADLKQPNQMLALIDSMMKTMPDSVRNKYKLEKIKSEEKAYQRYVDLYADNKHWIYTILTTPKMASIHVRPNRLKGTRDSTRFVIGLKNAYEFRRQLKLNPAAILQLMSNDSTELNYVGTSFSEEKEYQLVQMKWADKWLDVYFDKETAVLTKLIEAQTDMDPLMGRGPQHYKNIIFYLQYRFLDGFLLPASVEEVSTRSDFTTRKQLTWVSLNEAIPDSIFSPVLSDEETIKFRFGEIGSGLQVMEQSGRFQNKRSLVRVKKSAKLELFTDLSNDERQTNKMLEAMDKKFPGLSLSDAFNVSHLHGVTAQTAFFARRVHLFAPKDRQELKGVYNGKFENDSLRNKMHDAGLLTTFDKEFQKDDVQALMLNRGFTWTCYYLPADKVIYFSGTAYPAVGAENAAPYEKWIYDHIKDKKLNVEKLVYSGAFTDNAPLFMYFQEFEKRILGTDFSIYEPRKP